jgi:hypothetical protein
MFASYVSGIPCQINVTYHAKVKGSFSLNAPSDWDYYGYSEFEFEVYDRKGYRAKWLERKLTSDDEARIEEEYNELMND